jgi:hypothetical protein
MLIEMATSKKKSTSPKKTAGRRAVSNPVATKPAAKKAEKPAAKKAAKPAAKKAEKPTAKTVARDVHRVSPLRGMPVDVWVDQKTSPWQADIVRRVIEVIRKAAPEATCSIKWGQPVWEHNGPFAFFKPAKAHVSVGFWRGSEIADPKGILERGDRMGHFKLRDAADLDAPALAAMVRDAIRLNQEKGTPTRR